MSCAPELAPTSHQSENKGGDPSQQPPGPGSGMPSVPNSPYGQPMPMGGPQRGGPNSMYQMRPPYNGHSHQPRYGGPPTMNHVGPPETGPPSGPHKIKPSQEWTPPLGYPSTPNQAPPQHPYERNFNELATRREVWVWWTGHATVMIPPPEKRSGHFTCHNNPKSTLGKIEFETQMMTDQFLVHKKWIVPLSQYTYHPYPPYPGGYPPMPPHMGGPPMQHQGSYRYMGPPSSSAQPPPSSGMPPPGGPPPGSAPYPPPTSTPNSTQSQYPGYAPPSPSRAGGPGPPPQRTPPMSTANAMPQSPVSSQSHDAQQQQTQPPQPSSMPTQPPQSQQQPPPMNANPPSRSPRPMSPNVAPGGPQPLHSMAAPMPPTSTGPHSSAPAGSPQQAPMDGPPGSSQYPPSTQQNMPPPMQGGAGYPGKPGGYPPPGGSGQMPPHHPGAGYYPMRTPYGPPQSYGYYPQPHHGYPGYPQGPPPPQQHWNGPHSGGPQGPQGVPPQGVGPPSAPGAQQSPQGPPSGKGSPQPQPRMPPQYLRQHLQQKLGGGFPSHPPSPPVAPPSSSGAHSPISHSTASRNGDVSSMDSLHDETSQHSTASDDSQKGPPSGRQTDMPPGGPTGRLSHPTTPLASPAGSDHRPPSRDMTSPSTPHPHWAQPSPGQAQRSSASRAQAPPPLISPLPPASSILSPASSSERVQSFCCSEELSTSTTPPPPLLDFGGYRSSDTKAAPAPSPFPRTAKAKQDSLSRLSEMDGHPERKPFVERLIAFMEERGSPIAQCPTVSKQPLDLFRLYASVREQGGFLEVCQKKTWKEIAHSMNITNTQGSYTLRKQYIKFLLPYECKFDRGGMDYNAALTEMEKYVGGKKKSSPSTRLSSAPATSPSAPSPAGSSSSQDSFPPGGPPQAAMAPEQQSYGPAPGQAQMNGLPPPRGNSVSASNPFDDQQPSPRIPPTAPTGPPSSGPPYPPHSAPYPQGMPPSAQMGPPGAASQYPYPTQQTPPPQGTSLPPSGSWGPQARPPYAPPTAPGYPPRPAYPQSSDLSRYSAPPPPSSGYPPTSQFDYAQRPPTPQSSSAPPPPSPGAPPSKPGPPSSLRSALEATPAAPPSAPQMSTKQPPGQASTPALSHHLRPRGAPIHQSPPQPAPPLLRSPSPLVPRPPGQPGYPTKPGSYPPGPRQGYPGYPGQNSSHPGSWMSPQQPLTSGQPPYPTSEPSSQPPSMMHPGTYASSSAPSTPPEWGGPPSSAPGGPPSRFPHWTGGQMRMRSPFPSSPQGFRQPHPPGGMMHPSMSPQGRGPPPLPASALPYPPPSSYLKREVTFPPDSVEGVTPVMRRRKRLGKADVAPVEPWRLVMALKSGLLSEATWAIDVLNILLFDDSSIVYFGLSHLPGLLDLILEQHRRTLNAVFHLADDLEVAYDLQREKKAPIPWWFAKDKEDKGGKPSTEGDVDLGVPKVNNGNGDKKRLLLKLRRKPLPAVLKQEPTEEDLLRSDQPRSFDMFDALQGNENQEGVYESTSHILTHFEWEDSMLASRILRHLPTSPMYNIRKRKIKVEDETAVAALAEESVDDGAVGTLEDGPPEYHAIRKRRLLEMAEKEREKKLAEDPEQSVDKVKLLDQSNALENGKKEVEALDENYLRDEPCLNLVSECQTEMGARCVAVSTVLRNLSFVPGNDLHMSRSKQLLTLVSRVLTIHHPHTSEEDAGDNKEADQWKVDILPTLRENALVILANISPALRLWMIEEENVLRPLLEGVLHWAACGSVDALDPVLSPQRLAIEVLVKLSIYQENVDYILATPPAERLEKLAKNLSLKLSRPNLQVDRELSINIVESWSKHRNMAALTTIPALISFIEQVESTAHSIANTHGVGLLRDNPEAMGTSLDMVRRAARALLHLSQIPDNRPLFDQYEQRILTLVCSQILDQQVAGTLANVLYSNSSDVLN
ncbi:unnamed protein product [Cyprideis torosa]|uniref:Uncharacterized protein n=1 Tax=Cyprideis torosa TaxID=163714 RepID=A0A7R8W677_9CRUS|nr:unnamed protein product [Cyprideis torosa]CAG0886192.1 unnamed protein product [Cyprideis torosa]